MVTSFARSRWPSAISGCISIQARKTGAQGRICGREAKERRRKKKKGNAPQFDLRTELFRLTGADLTQIERG